MRAFETMLIYETEQTLYQMHTANALSIIANGLVALGGKDLDYPLYTDLINKTQKSQDTRTADEIKRDLVQHLLK